MAGIKAWYEYRFFKTLMAFSLIIFINKIELEMSYCVKSIV